MAAAYAAPRPSHPEPSAHPATDGTHAGSRRSRNRRRRALANGVELLGAVLLEPREVVMIVDQLDLAAAEQRHDLARDPLPTRVGVASREIHELPVGVANRRMDVEQHLALGRALAPRLVLRQREKAVRDTEAKAPCAEVHANPDPT